MITTVRVPIYLMLESQNMDRAKVTKLLDQLIIPEITKHLISFGNKMNLDPHEITHLKLHLGDSFELKLVSDVQAMAKK